MINLTFSIWLGTQFTQPNPGLGPLQGECWTLLNSLTKKRVKTCNWKSGGITDREKGFRNNPQSFFSFKTPNKLPKPNEKDLTACLITTCPKEGWIYLSLGNHNLWLSPQRIHKVEYGVNFW